MRLEQIREILNCRVVTGHELLHEQVIYGSAADLMSDVLAFAQAHSVLLTGLANAQCVRTAQIADVKAIVYVRGKQPDDAAVELAKQLGVVLLTTDLSMFDSCGRLHACGLRGRSDLLRDASHVRTTGVQPVL